MAKYTKGSFIVVPNKDALRGMKPQTQALFLWLCHYANTSGKCFPAKKTLAADCGMSEASVLRSMDELIKACLVEKTIRKQKGDRNQSNVYTVMFGGGGCHTDTQGVSHSNPGGYPSDALTQLSKELDPFKSAQGAETQEAEKKQEEDLKKADGAAVNKVIDAFARVNPSFDRLYRMTPQRDAVRRLVKKFGLEQVINGVHGLEITNKMKGTPIITTPIQLEQNLGWLIEAMKKKKVGKEIM